MISEIRHWWALKKLQKRRRRLVAVYDAQIAKARKEKKPEDDSYSIYREMRFELEWVDEDIAKIHSAYLFEQAQKYLVPTPEFDRENGDWIESEFGQTWRLSPKAMTALRSSIRAEQKERREYWRGFLGSATGVLGALIGLLAFLDKVLRGP